MDMAKRLAAVAFLWPVFSTRNCFRFLRAEPLGRRTAIFFTEFLPIVGVTWILWAAAWLIGLRLVVLLY
jgi:hypothetical protein